MCRAHDPSLSTQCHFYYFPNFGWSIIVSLATQTDVALNWEMVSGSSWQFSADVWHSSYSMWEWDSICGGISLNQTCCEDKMPKEGICLGAGLSWPPNICISVFLFLLLKSYHLCSTEHSLCTRQLLCTTNPFYMWENQVSEKFYPSCPSSCRTQVFISRLTLF